MNHALSRLQANSLLLLTAGIWGFAFVPQAIVSKYIGPLSFTGLRFILGALVISPLVWREWQQLRTNGHIPTAGDWRQIALMGVLLCIGSCLQQIGLAYTSVTNAGFLTGLYVPLVPILAWLLYRRHAHWIIWPTAIGCAIGTWLLTGAGNIQLNVGDLWILATIVPFALHILWIGELAEKMRAPLLVAWGQFMVCGVLAGVLALPTESFNPQFMNEIFWPLAYMSMISVGIGFTSQVIAQRYARPAESAIILSSETVFAAISGAIFLHERLSLLGYIGATLIFIGIIVVQLAPNQTPMIEQH